MGQQLPFLIAATPDLFDILGIEVVQGRPFTAADDSGDLVVIVNETMAREVWPAMRLSASASESGSIPISIRSPPPGRLPPRRRFPAVS